MLRASSVVLVCATVAFAATPARADETLAVTPYAAWRRPLTPLVFPGPPPLRRSVGGAAIEWADLPAENRSGWILRFGGAVEHQADCPTSASCSWPGGDATDVPGDHVEWGAHARFGWFWRRLQLEGGLLVYSATIAGRSPRESFLLPDAVARVGSRSAFVALGFGTFSGATILLPTTYVQGELSFADRWTSTFTFAAHNHPLAARDVAPYQHLRFDVAMRYRVNRAIRTGVGLALTASDPDAARTRLGGELRLIFEWTTRESPQRTGAGNPPL